MKFLVIDTETSGLFNFGLPADAEGQPRLATLALIVCDENFDVLGRLDLMVKPDGWVMAPEASKVNGLTTEHLLEHGIPIAEVLKHYTDLVDRGLIVITFNAQFDTKVMRGELRRLGLPDRFETTLNVCVMRASTDVVKIPYKTKRPGFKFPKLSEACAFFKIEQPAAHSAMGDAESARLIAKGLQTLGMFPAATVNYAKTQPATL